MCNVIMNKGNDKREKIFLIIIIINIKKKILYFNILKD